MKTPIGFSMQPKVEKKEEEKQQNFDCPQVSSPTPSVVTVAFENGKQYSYYNDCFELEVGDYVYVDGKLAGKRGQVIFQTYQFCVNLKYYKRVLQKINRTVHGTFIKSDMFLVCRDATALPYSQIHPWFFPPETDGEKNEIVYGEGFRINLSGDNSCFDCDYSDYKTGVDYFYDKTTQYISCVHGVGQVIIKDTHDPQNYVTVSFHYVNGTMESVYCDCIEPGFCPHIHTAATAIRYLLDNHVISEENPDFCALSVDLFSQFVENRNGQITV